MFYAPFFDLNTGRRLTAKLTAEGLPAFDLGFEPKPVDRIGNQFFILAARVKSHICCKLGLTSRWELISRFRVPTIGVDEIPSSAGPNTAAATGPTD